MNGYSNFSWFGRPANRVRVDVRETRPTATFGDPGLRTLPLSALRPTFIDPVLDDEKAAFAAAPVKVEEAYATPPQHQNPIELYSTTYVWSGGRLTIHEPSAAVNMLKHGVAVQLGVAPESPNNWRYPEYQPDDTPPRPHDYGRRRLQLPRLCRDEGGASPRHDRARHWQRRTDQRTAGARRGDEGDDRRLSRRPRPQRPIPDPADLTDEEIAAYDAPFPDRRFQAGARTFPDLAMVTPEMEGVAEARAALKFGTNDWSGPSFMAIGAKDPDVDTMQKLRAMIRGCPEPTIFPDAGHFVQEHGQEVARAALLAFGDL